MSSLLIQPKNGAQPPRRPDLPGQQPLVAAILESPGSTSGPAKPEPLTPPSLEPSKGSADRPSRPPRRSASVKAARRTIANCIELIGTETAKLCATEAIQVRSELIRRLAAANCTDAVKQLEQICHRAAEAP